MGLITGDFIYDILTGDKVFLLIIGLFSDICFQQCYHILEGELIRMLEKWYNIILISEI